MIKILPNAQRAKNLIIIFYVLVGCECISIISAYLQYDLLANITDYIDPNTAEMNDIRQQMVGFITFAIYITSIVLFIMWFRRAYHNLHLAGVTGLKFSEGWAAGCWFIPFVNLTRPYNIMEEIWDETQRITTVGHKIKDDSLVGIWWASWIITNIVSQVAMRLSLSADDINELTNASIADIVASLMAIISGIIVINLIKQVSRFEQSMFLFFQENK